jgi:aspartate kinase
MTGIIVSKYGGSSITRHEDVKRINKITEDDSHRQVIVVSAPRGVTDMLIRLAKNKSPSLVEEIIDRYRRLSKSVSADVFNYFSIQLQQRVEQPLEKAKYLDSLKAFGEETCARFVAEEIGAQFVDAKELFLVSKDYGNAKILPQSEGMIKKRLANKKGVFVIPGFYGYTTQGDIATFSRGGSDLSGAYIAASLDAELYENFTDTDGIYAASPEIVKDPKKVDIITFDEIRDLAYSGFKVLHEEAMNPVGRKRIPVHVRNTFNYPSKGTYVVHDRLSDPDKPIVGVAYKDGFCSFDVATFGMNDRVGVGRQMLQVFEEKGIPIEFITTGIDDLSVIFREDELKKSPDSINDIVNKLYSVMGEDSLVDFQEHLGSLVVAGKGLKGRKGVSANIQLTLAEADVNIRFISQGPLERCIIYGINGSDSKRAVNAVYDKYLR